MATQRICEHKDLNFESFRRYKVTTEELEMIPDAEECGYKISYIITVSFRCEDCGQVLSGEIELE